MRYRGERTVEHATRREQTSATFSAYEGFESHQGLLLAVYKETASSGGSGVRDMLS